MRKIAIQVSADLSPNARGAESHTLVSIVEILNEEFSIDIVGTDTLPSGINYLNVYNKFKVKNKKNKCKIEISYFLFF